MIETDVDAYEVDALNQDSIEMKKGHAIQMVHNRERIKEYVWRLTEAGLRVRALLSMQRDEVFILVGDTGSSGSTTTKFTMEVTG